MKRQKNLGQPKANVLSQGKDGLGKWSTLHEKRRGMLTRFEDYAAVTIPKVCLPDNVDQNTASIQHDWTSVGAQAVNHLTNKIVLSLFRPGMPFFRLDPNKELRRQLDELGVTETDFRESLVAGEQDALKVMDQKAIRPKLNELVKHLVVTGNVTLDLEDEDQPRVIGVRHYVAKRSISGRLIHVLIREKVLWDELSDDVQEAVPRPEVKQGEHAYVQYIRWYHHKGKKWYYTQHVDGFQLPEKFDKVYDEDTMPVHVLTWDLADEHDYGTGLVEDYAGDFGTLSTLSEAEIKAAILASDYRWLANPAGVGDISEFKTSTTGDVIMGVKDDLNLVALTSANGLELISKSADKVISRIGRAFLMSSAVTRDAERVTAEEIRMQAQELETSLGGVYSRLAVELQLPIAVWLLSQIDVTVKGTKLVPTIVTGLAALSRNAEAQQLQLFLQDMAVIATYPPELSGRLMLDAVMSTLASAHGIAPGKYVKPEQQYQQELAAQAQAQTEQIASQEASKAGAQALAQRNQNQ